MSKTPLLQSALGFAVFFYVPCLSIDSALSLTSATLIKYMVTSLGLCPVHQLFDLNTSMWHALILLTKGINSFVCLSPNKWCFSGIQSLSVRTGPDPYANTGKNCWSFSTKNRKTMSLPVLTHRGRTTAGQALGCVFSLQNPCRKPGAFICTHAPV